MMIIHLNGWPGVGKRTIGASVASRLGARFIHNHLLHDVAIQCAGFNGAQRWPLYEKVRAAAYETLALLPLSEIILLTNGLCNDTPREELAWRYVVDLAMRRRAPLVPVVLEASLFENLRRVQTVERAARQKLVDPIALEEMTQRGSIQKPAVPELIVVDVTELTVEEAASRILQHLERIKTELKPATFAHLQMQSHPLRSADSTST
jgi:broad-specificity NMP kinase